MALGPREAEEPNPHNQARLDYLHDPCQPFIPALPGSVRRGSITWLYREKYPLQTTGRVFWRPDQRQANQIDGLA